MAITGPQNVDVYNMISSLADNYLKNRSLKQAHDKQEEELKARRNLSELMQNNTPSYNMMASNAAQMGEMGLASRYHALGMQQGQGQNMPQRLQKRGNSSTPPQQRGYDIGNRDPSPMEYPYNVSLYYNPYSSPEMNPTQIGSYPYSIRGQGYYAPYNMIG